MLLGAFAGALIASGASGGLPTEPLPRLTQRQRTTLKLASAAGSPSRLAG